MNVTAVDCHAHVLAKDFPITSDRHTPPQRDYTVQELLGIFDAHGISHGLVTAPSYYLTNNTLLLQSLRSATRRLRGTVILDPATSAKQIEELDSSGVCGVRLNWWRRKSIPDIREYADLMCTIRDAGWHLELFIDGVHIPEVLPVIEATGVKLVLDHFACPEPSKGIRGPGFLEVLRSMQAGRTWVKLSGPYRLAGGDASAYAKAFLHAAGPERLVWGSDWPWGGFEVGMTYQRCLDWLVEWVPDPTQRGVILTETPSKLFGFSLEETCK